MKTVCINHAEYGWDGDPIEGDDVGYVYLKDGLVLEIGDRAVVGTSAYTITEIAEWAAGRVALWKAEDDGEKLDAEARAQVFDACPLHRRT